jgi:hypothetical protein
VGGSRADITRFVLRAWLASRVMLLVCLFVSLNLLPAQPEPGGFQPTIFDRGHFLWNGLTLWDGGWYWRIVENGYVWAPRQSNVAFFPGYPLAAVVVGKMVGNAGAGGLLVSHLSLLGALWFLAQSALRHGGERLARAVVVAVLLHPLSFMYSCFYSESLYFLAVCGAFYFLEIGQFSRAAALGVLASFTRSTGILLLPALVLGALQQNQWKPRKDHAWLLLIPVGLLCFMAWLALEPRVGNPLAFMDAQKAWGRQAQTPMATLFAEGDVRKWAADGNVMARMLDFTFVTLAWGAGVLAWRRLGAAHAVFALAVVLVPLTSGAILSMGRFSLGIPALFLVAGDLTLHRPRLSLMLTAVTPALMMILMSAFSQWRFVG